MKRSILIFLCSAGILIVFLVLLTLKLPFNTILWREIHNTGHTPLFAFLSLCILGMLFQTSGARLKHGIYPYLLAFTITIFLGGAFEIYQIWGPGDPDIIDFLRDIAGAFPALALALVFNMDSILIWNRIGKSWKYVILTGAIIVWLLAFVPVGLWVAAYYERNQIYPTVLDFDSPLDLKFVITKDAMIEAVPPPSGWPGFSAGKVGQVTFLPGDYPGIEVREPYPNWSGKKVLKFDIFSKQTAPIMIVIRIDDIHHNREYSDRFNRRIIVIPGENEIIVPLDDIKNAPAKRKMDMTAIRNLMLFTADNKEKFSLYFDNVRLE